MTDFVRPKPRFDSSIANVGVWFYPTDENGTEYGGFKIRLWDKQLPRYRVTLERLQREYGPKGKKKNVDDKIAAIMLCELALVDWDQVDTKGKAIPFSEDKAIEYFTLTDVDAIGEKYLVFGWVMSWLDERSQEVRWFQPDEQKDEPEKN